MSPSHSTSMFVHERPRLLAIAYRMLGSASDAEDVVQEALVRATQRDDLASTPAFLATVVTRLCIDEKRSARRRRVSYVGPYLPEPIPTDRLDAPSLADVEYRENVSMAFMRLLDQLSPAERAVYVLRELFEVEMSAIAAALDRSEASCRKLLERARAHVASGRRSRVPERDAQDAIANAFLLAIATGDLDALCTLLADDAKLVTDHGGTSSAARRTIEGALDIARFFVGLVEKGQRLGVVLVPVRVSLTGQPAIVLRHVDGTIETALVLDVSPREAGVAVGTVFAFRDVHKLETLRAALDAETTWAVTPPRT